METTKGNTPVQNAVKLIGETFIPGASLLLDGNILGGGAHFIVGTLAKAALGPIGLALVIANSYSQSSTGRSLLKQLSSDDRSETKVSVTTSST